MYLGFTIPVYCYNRVRSIDTLLECLEKNSYLHHDVVLVLDNPKTPPRIGELLPGNPYPTVWDLLNQKWKNRRTENIDIRVSFRQNTKDPENSQWLSVAETVNYAATVALSNRVLSLSNPDFYLAPNWDYNLVKYGLGNSNMALCSDLYYDYGYQNTATPEYFLQQRDLARPANYYTYPYKYSSGVRTFDWSRTGYPKFSFPEQDFLNYAAEISVAPNQVSIVGKDSPPFYTMAFDKRFFMWGGGIPIIDGQSGDRWNDLAIMPPFYKLVAHDSIALTYHCDLELCDSIVYGPGTSWFIPLKPEYANIVIRTKGSKADFFAADTMIRFARADNTVITTENELLFSALRQYTLPQFAAIVCSLEGKASCDFKILHTDSQPEIFRFSVDHKLEIPAESRQTLRPRSRFQIAKDPEIIYTPPIPIRDMLYMET